MTRIRNPLVIALVALAVASCSSSEEQVDLKPFTDATTAYFAANGMTLTIDDAKPDGSDVVLEGVSVAATGTPPVKIDEIRMQDVKEQDDGYRVTAIRAPKFSYSAEGRTLEFDGAEFRGITIPKKTASDPMDHAMLMESAKFDAVRGKDENGEVFRLASVKYEATPYEPGKPVKYTMEINGIEADTANLPDARSRDMMTALGYDRIKGSISGSGSWDPESGRVVTDSLVYKVDDAAALTVSADIGGITPEFVAALQDLSERQASGDTSGQLSGLAYMGLMQQLVFNRLQVRFDDASVTNKVIDFMAKQRGVTREELIAQAKGVVPAMLMQLRNPVFAQEVGDAVSTYLDDPKSLTVTLDPAKPVRAPTLMATGMAAPQTLPDVLGAKVTANE